MLQGPSGRERRERGGDQERLPELRHRRRRVHHQRRNGHGNKLNSIQTSPILFIYE